MNGEIKRRWVAALRSGEYKRTSGTLCETGFPEGGDRHCCLGVLEELAVGDGVVVRNTPPVGFTVYRDAARADGGWGDEQVVMLTHRTMEWAGLGRNPSVPLDSELLADHDFGDFGDFDRDHYEWEGGVPLADLNDRMDRDDLTYGVIPDLIEREL